MGPSAQNNDQVRKARGNAHALIKGFSESLPRYALTEFTYQMIQGTFLYAFNALQCALNTEGI